MSESLRGMCSISLSSLTLRAFQFVVGSWNSFAVELVIRDPGSFIVSQQFRDSGLEILFEVYVLGLDIVDALGSQSDASESTGSRVFVNTSVDEASVGAIL